MTRTISPNQLVTGGDRRISHGVAKARDAIHAASSLRTGCGILDTDLVAAFCNMVLTWCLQVLKKKGLSQNVIKRYENLYNDHVSLIVVNTIIGRSVRNIRLTIRQGDKFAKATNSPWSSSPLEWTPYSHTLKNASKASLFTPCLSKAQCP